MAKSALICRQTQYVFTLLLRWCTTPMPQCTRLHLQLSQLHFVLSFVVFPPPLGYPRSFCFVHGLSTSLHLVLSEHSSVALLGLIARLVDVVRYEPCIAVEPDLHVIKLGPG